MKTFIFKNYLKKNFDNFTLNHFPSVYRPSSFPVISGDTFRKISDHIFDETETLNISKIKHNDVVFLKGTLIKQFFLHYHPKIKNKYILIIHNSTDEINSEIFNYLDKKIIHCFAKNLNVESNNNISVLPVGFKDKRFLDNNYYTQIYKFYKNKPKIKKNNRIFAAFSQDTNFERVHLKNKLKELSFVDVYEHLNIETYFEKLSQYSFCICPRGTSIDSFRIWESILTHTTPIVLKTPFTENLKETGAPLLLLSDWRELNSFKTLKEKQLKISSHNNLEIISYSFWKNRIFEKKLNYID